MRILSFSLVLLGVLAVVSGTTGIGDFRAVLDAAPVEAADPPADPTVPVSPILGGIAIVSGLLLLPRRRKP
jgi:hypothetical protein